MTVVASMTRLLLMALCCRASSNSKQFRPMWYRSDPLTWSQAQTECRSVHKAELLTVLSQAELDVLDMTSYYAWVGRVPHYFFLHDGSISGRCGLATFQKEKQEAVSCSKYYFFFCGDVSSYVFMPRSMTWDQAQAECGSKGLAIASPSSGYNHLRWPGSPVYVPREFPVWIGMHDAGSSWSWSDGEESDYSNWRSDLGSGPNPGSGDCVSVGSLSKSMSAHSCSDIYPYVCYNKNLALLPELMTWEQAAALCKTLSSTSNLLSVDQNHMTIIKKVLGFAQTNKVWVGLRFLAGSWFWSDITTVPLPALPSCPGFTLGCGALVLSSGSDPVIEATDCSEKLNLLCYDPALYL